MEWCIFNHRLGKLVREGSSLPAIVRVTLLNTGVDAYRPDAYGSKITIERRIPRTGTASYRLLDERLKVTI
jgi:chromosome segregation ATPase